MFSLDEFALRKLSVLEAGKRRRRLAETAPGEGARVRRGGRELLSFCSNDYLGLAAHPAIVAAASGALRENGLGAGASRLITGNHPLYAALETRLASWKGADAAMVFGSGYLANLGTIPALAGAGDLILIDELAHACLYAGARLSRAEVVPFPHNDTEALSRRLAAQRGRACHALVVTEGVFSMDGDLAPLPALAQLAEVHDAWLLVDDAHGLGTLAGGRGAAHAFGADPVRVPLQTGTLSKALGAYGGYLAASRPVIELLHSRARSFVYATALPPAVIAGAAAALDFVAAHPEIAALPVRNARLFTRALDLPPAQSQIVPMVLGSEERALAASAALEAAGFLVTAIRPPTVPQGTARLRFAFSALHTERDVLALAEAVRARVLVS
ncbi:MAG: 8-amino-7-oxononanoate synthase [Alphaproteobacteria bacterium]